MPQPSMITASLQKSQERWQFFAAQVNSNARLRRMVWGIIYIILFYLILVVSDELIIVKDDTDDLQRTLSKLEKYEGQLKWKEWLNAERALSLRIESRFWSAASPGLAEADIQTYLQQLAHETKIVGLRLKSGDAESVQLKQAHFWKIQAEISGTMERENVPKLMHALASNHSRVTVERFTYSPERGQRISMLITAYFKQATD